VHATRRPRPQAFGQTAAAPRRDRSTELWRGPIRLRRSSRSRGVHVLSGRRSRVNDETEKRMTRRNYGRAGKFGRRLAIMAATAFAVAVAVPAVAAASTLWVSPAPVKSPFNSCIAPGYNTIQEAINVNAPAPKTVHVCLGTYTEQLQINKPQSIFAPPGVTVTASGITEQLDNELRCSGTRVRRARSGHDLRRRQS
jgi:pectin methylesterase-like acyl-CoA thioesterase